MAVEFSGYYTGPLTAAGSLLGVALGLIRWPSPQRNGSLRDRSIPRPNYETGSRNHRVGVTLVRLAVSIRRARRRGRRCRRRTRCARFEEGLEVITRPLRFDDPVSYDGRFFRPREGLRRRRLVAYRACLLTATARQAATAKIRATFSAEKNSAGEITPATVRANPSIAS
jgi:hypothetical protein